MDKPIVEQTEPDQHEATPPAVRRALRKDGDVGCFALLLLGGVIGFLSSSVKKRRRRTNALRRWDLHLQAVAEKGSIAVYINA